MSKTARYLNTLFVGEAIDLLDSDLDENLTMSIDCIHHCPVYIQSTSFITAFTYSS
jgi:hypothetical protein